VKIVRFEGSAGPALGAVAGEGNDPLVIELTSGLRERTGRWITDVGALLAAGKDAAAAAAEVAAAAARGTPLSGLNLLAPVGPAALIVSLGRNFLSHSAEMAAGRREPPARDAQGYTLRGFVKSARSLTGAGRDILLPPAHPDKVDYEGELGVVIGATCHAVTPDQAREHIAGYVLLNDVSARDWIPEVRAAVTPDQVRLAWDRNILGKQFPSFCPMGPWFASKDEFPDPGAIGFTTSVNGEERQRATVAELRHGLGQMVAYYAAFYELHPGDVITTGTPAGVGQGMKPPRFLRDGDVVTVSGEGLGELRNRVRRGG
jgi:2-keto-4-pentenoate hydratase/2-oxohepta-3-ene-1,7-dioic acid hydratase in catechol pathway